MYALHSYLRLHYTYIYFDCALDIIARPDRLKGANGMSQRDYIRTARVLDHFEEEINKALPEGVLSACGTKRLKPKIALLSGADLVESMSSPDVWSPEDLDHILGRFGVFVIERHGTDIVRALSGLEKWRPNIHVIQQVFQNNMSSTQIRLHIKREMSVRYRMFEVGQDLRSWTNANVVIPDQVIDYIQDTGLYQDHTPPRAATAQPTASSSTDKC